MILRSLLRQTDHLIIFGLFCSLKACRVNSEVYIAVEYAIYAMLIAPN